MDDLANVAVAMAERGWPLFPCWWAVDGRCGCGRAACASPGKHPIGALAPHGVKDASREPATIARWWRRYPRANIGLLCGTAFWVLDRDDDKGGATTLDRLIRTHGPLPATPTVVSGAGGRHYYLALPTGRRLGNSTGKLGPGLDTRAANGYVIGPPSSHASGRRYSWEPGHELDALPLAKAPPWLLDLLDPPPPPREPPRPVQFGVVSDAYVIAAIRRELDAVALAGEGARNETLNRAAFVLGRFVAAGVLDARDIGPALVGVALGTGLPRSEAEKTVASGLRAAIRGAG